MHITRFKNNPEFTAGDKTTLRQLLHPHTHKLPINFSMAHARLAVGKKSLPHRLDSTEVYYILQGKGRMHIDDENETVQVGDTVYIPPKSRQFIENIGSEKLVFICVVSPEWREENEIVEK